MLDIRKFKLEVLAKFIAKISGLVKQIAIIFFIGASESINNYFIATSFSAIILALIAWSEIEILPKLAKHSSKQVTKLTRFFILNLSLLATLILIILTLIVYSTTSVNIAFWTFLIGIWSIINLINNIWLINCRINNKSNEIFLYFTSSSIAGMIIFLILCISISLLGLNKNLYVTSLFISIIFPEIYYSIYWHKKNKKCSAIKVGFNTFIQRFLITKSSVSVLIILFLVYSIDATDKYFTTLLNSEKFGASLLIYGSLIPLILRNTFDVKTLFFTEINKEKKYINQLALFKIILFKIYKLYIPIMTIICILANYLGYYFLTIFELNFSLNQLKIIVSILIIYSFLTPLYIFWDLCYRFFHLYNHKISVTLLISIGYIINFIFNYVLALKYNMGVIGIALSTFIVYMFYTFISILYLIFLKKSHENTNC